MEDESPSKKKRRLEIERKNQTRSHSSKHRLPDDESSLMISPLKRLKISSPQCLDENMSKRETRSSVQLIKSSQDSNADHPKSANNSGNFIMACMKVCSEEYHNIQLRLGLKMLPDCCLDENLCQTLHGKTSRIVYTSMSTERETLKIYLQEKRYNESLRICTDVFRFHVYPSFEIMMDLIDILLHSHDNTLDDEPCPIVLSNCIRTFKIIFATHPPCHKMIRKNYTRFLVKMPKLDITNNHSINLKMDDGLFKFVIQQLQYEFTLESDEPLLEIKISKTNLKNEHSLNKLDKAYHDYDYFKRPERLKRLFIILEIIIKLLESDLAIWINKHINSTINMTRQHKPLIAVLLWKMNPLYTGMVNDTCKNIMQLFVTIIKQNCASRYITLFYRLINIMFHTFNLCEENHTTNFPNWGKYSNQFAKEMFKTINGEKIPVVRKIIKAIQCKHLQHLLTASILKSILNTHEESYIEIVLKIFKKQSWTMFNQTKAEPNNLKSKENNGKKFKDPKKELYHSFLVNLDSEIIKILLNKNKNNDSEESNFTLSDVDRDTFLEIFYYSFKSFLDSHNIEKIAQEYNNIDRDTSNQDNCVGMNCDYSDDFIAEFNKKIKVKPPTKKVSSLPLNSSTVKNFRFIFQSLKQISVLYNQVKNNNIQLRNLFQNFTVLEE